MNFRNFKLLGPKIACSPEALERPFSSRALNRGIIRFSKLQSRQLDHFTISAMSYFCLQSKKSSFLLTPSLLCMVVKRGMRFHFSDPIVTPETLRKGQFTLGRHCQPSLTLVASLLEQSVSDLDAANEERSLLLAKVQDVNELSRHEVDEIIKAYSRAEQANETDGMRRRRYLAMVEMCSAAGNRESLVALHCFIIEHALNILFIHYEKELLLPEQFRISAESLADTKSFLGSEEELRALNEKLLPILQQIERINEEKVACADKQIQRLVRSLKSRIVLGLQ